MKAQAQLRQTLVEYLETLHYLGAADMRLSDEACGHLRSLAVDGQGVAGAAAKKSGTRQAVDARVAAASTRARHVGSEGKPAQRISAADVVRERAPARSSLAPFTGDKADALQQLRVKLESDQNLRGMFRNAQRVVFGEGNPDAQLMFVGEAPGRDEDASGRPFVGEAGKLLEDMIRAMKLQRQDLYIANIVKYRPDMPPESVGNRKPTHEEMQASMFYIEEQIRIIRPKVLVALGATALEGLLGLKTARISSMRGQWQDFKGIPLMPTYHPALLLRRKQSEDKGVRERKQAWDDLKEVLRQLAE